MASWPHDLTQKVCLTMDPTTLAIGTYQPIPFPAPVWLMQILLVAGFYLHAIPMNATLMGGLVSAILLLGGKATNQPNAERAGKTLAYSLPFFTTLAITNGIVPLLFLQVLYGPVIYTSSIIMAVPWFSILILLAVGYYSLYLFSYKREWLGARSPWVLIFSSLLFLVIAFFFTNNMTLMLTPQKFLSMYQANTNGFNLNLGEQTLLPRYLHFVVGATAVTGLVMGCFGLYQHNRDRDYSNWLLKLGSGLYLAMTFLQFVIGPWFLFSLPQAVSGQLLDLSNHYSHPFYLAMVLDLVSIAAMGIAWTRQSAGAFKVGLYAALTLVASMIWTRHNLRLIMLSGLVDPAAHMQKPQIEMLVIFGLLTAGTIALLVWLGKITWKAFHPDQPASASGK